MVVYEAGESAHVPCVVDRSAHRRREPSGARACWQAISDTTPSDTDIPDFCGYYLPYNTTDFGDDKSNCCAVEVGLQDCDEDEPLEVPTGPAYPAVKNFAKYEWLFLHGYMEAWWAATTNGYYKSLQVRRRSTLRDPLAISMHRSAHAWESMCLEEHVPRRACA